MYLKTRIIVALAAIAVIHLSFYAAPRFYYTRARFYADAYDEAIGILRGQFGGEAVEKGIVSIPREPISIPYEGIALLRGKRLVLRSSGGASWIIDCRYDQDACRCAVGRVSGERARHMWAVLAYLGMAECTFDGACNWWHVPEPYPALLSDRTFPWSYGKNDCNVMRPREEKTVLDAVRFLCQMQYAKDLVRAEDIEYSTRENELLPALETIMRWCVPPKSGMDGESVEGIADEYARIAGRKALRLLRKIEAYGRGPRMYFIGFRNLPVIGPRLKAWNRKRYENWKPKTSYYGVSHLVWLVEALDGKSEEEQFAVLRAAAFKKGADPEYEDEKRFTDAQWQTYEVMQCARGILRARWPERFNDLLADNYDAVSTVSKTAYLDYWSDGKPPSERFARMAIEDPSDDVRVFGYEALWRLTRDKSAIVAIEEIARAKPQPQQSAGAIVNAIRTLVWLYSEDRSVADVPQFLRTMLSSYISPDSEFITLCALDMTGFNDSRALQDFVPLLREIVSEPDKILHPNLTAGSRLRLRLAAGTLLSRWSAPEAVDEFLRYLSVPHKDEESWVTYHFVEALGNSGNVRALPVLEWLASDPPLPSTEGHDPFAFWQASEFRSDYVRHAIARIRLKNARSPAELFVSMDSDERGLVTLEDLVLLFTDDELEALFLSDGCKNARPTIFLARYAMRN